jgi:flagellar capping protein FliD
MQQPYRQYRQYCQYCQVHYTLDQSQTHHQCQNQHQGNYPSVQGIPFSQYQPYQFTLQDLANKIDAIRDNLNKQNLEILAKLIELIAKQ